VPGEPRSAADQWGRPSTVLDGPPAAAGTGADGASGPERAPDSPRAPAAPAPAAAPAAALPLGASQLVQVRTVADALVAYAERIERAETRRVSAARRWKVGKVPLRPPAPPDRKPELAAESGQLAGEGLPPVITRVPTEDKVVFLTIDDGAEKDPELLAVMRELAIPYSAFLADYVSRDDYGYFRRMHADGAAIHNHSVNHREMTRLTYAQQRKEICTQQDVLEREIGERPALFRPPYGAYDRNTLRAAAACGVEVVPLWAAEAFADRMEWSRADRRLHPGDIILTHFRGEGQWAGSMADMVRRVVRTATAQGFAIARLEDYL
jgi:peptidoglycan/xylan/chitin deacetylase (PgdA/CDA1 family)